MNSIAPGTLTGWQFLRLACSLRSAPGSQDRTRPGRESPETFASVLAETRRWGCRELSLADQPRPAGTENRPRRSGGHVDS